MRDVLFDTPLTYSVIYKISVPPGYKLKNALPEVEINSRFGGRYLQRTEILEKEVSVTGELQLSNKMIPVADYQQLIQMLDRVIKSLGKEIVFQKSENNITGGMK
jgi:hypothetical protein